MSTTYIPEKVRQQVAATADYRCGYCLSQEIVIGMPMEIEHIIPEALGGSSEEDNLWLACSRCNRFKGDNVSAIDTQTKEMVSLYNPRHQVWIDHFRWENNGLYVVGITPTGRVTVDTLQMNNSHIVRARRLWIAAGWHPPA